MSVDGHLPVLSHQTLYGSSHSPRLLLHTHHLPWKANLLCFVLGKTSVHLSHIKVVSLLRVLSFVLFCFFPFLGPHPQHMEVPRLGDESELQLLACTTTIAMRDPSQVCDLHHSSRQCWIFNPLSEARDWTHVLMDTSWVCYRWAMTGTPKWDFYAEFKMTYNTWCSTLLKRC